MKRLWKVRKIKFKFALINFDFDQEHLQLQSRFFNLVRYKKNIEKTKTRKKFVISYGFGKKPSYNCLTKAKIF